MLQGTAFKWYLALITWYKKLGALTFSKASVDNGIDRSLIGDLAPHARAISRKICKTIIAEANPQSQTAGQQKIARRGSNLGGNMYIYYRYV